MSLGLESTDYYYLSLSLFGPALQKAHNAEFINKSKFQDIGFRVLIGLDTCASNQHVCGSGH